MASISSTKLQQVPEREISGRVLEEVAAQEGTSPVDLDQPLYDVVDPDALNALFAGSTPPATVRFTYLDYEIVVHGDGRIDVVDDDRRSD